MEKLKVDDLTSFFENNLKRVLTESERNLIKWMVEKNKN